jgi:RHS repeat-associated protein
VTTLFVYDAFDHLVAEYTNPTQQPQSGAGTSYITTDHLASTRLVTDTDGAVKARHDYLPFGEELTAGIGSRSSGQGYGVNEGLRQKFTSKQRDAESGLDYFGARYYASTQGRFTSTDPLDESAHILLPQTWNRYSYVLNNPLNVIDPNGMGWLHIDGTDGLYWDSRVNSQEDADKYYPGRRAQYLPYGTVGTITYGRGKGHTIVLGFKGSVIDLGVLPKEVKQIEWYGGDGEKFLRAYLRFALENAVTGVLAAKAVEKLYQIAKATGTTAKLKKLMCFPAGTPVSTPNGSAKIEDIKPGDDVYAFDFASQEIVTRKVTAVHTGQTLFWIRIHFNNQELLCTRFHPLWVENLQKWVQAVDLECGMKIRLEDGTLGTIDMVSIVELNSPVTTYNFEVEEEHNYFAGVSGVLVHNGQDNHPGWLPKLANKNAEDSARTIQLEQAKAAKRLEGTFGIERVDIPKGDILQPGNMPHAHGKGWSVNIDGSVHDAKSNWKDLPKAAREALRKVGWGC